jgi:hypothetical protein
MRLPFVALSLVGLAAVVPAVLEKRQTTSNELNGACRKVILVFARASTESGNMVRKRNENDAANTNTQIGHVNGPSSL